MARGERALVQHRHDCICAELKQPRRLVASPRKGTLRVSGRGQWRSEPSTSNGSFVSCSCDVAPAGEPHSSSVRRIIRSAWGTPIGPDSSVSCMSLADPAGRRRSSHIRGTSQNRVWMSASRIRVPRAERIRNARAVSLNVTAVQPRAQGHLVAFATGIPNARSSASPIRHLELFERERSSENRPAPPIISTTAMAMARKPRSAQHGQQRSYASSLVCHSAL